VVVDNYNLVVKVGCMEAIEEEFMVVARMVVVQEVGCMWVAELHLIDLFHGVQEGSKLN
jgi:hypothetical protein